MLKYHFNVIISIFILLLPNPPLKGLWIITPDIVAVAGEEKTFSLVYFCMFNLLIVQLCFLGRKDSSNFGFTAALQSQKNKWHHGVWRNKKHGTIINKNICISHSPSDVPGPCVFAAHQQRGSAPPPRRHRGATPFAKTRACDDIYLDRHRLVEIHLHDKICRL